MIKNYFLNKITYRLLISVTINFETCKQNCSTSGNLSIISFGLQESNILMKRGNILYIRNSFSLSTMISFECTNSLNSFLICMIPSCLVLLSSSPGLMDMGIVFAFRMLILDFLFKFI